MSNAMFEKGINIGRVTYIFIKLDGNFSMLVYFLRQFYRNNILGCTVTLKT